MTKTPASFLISGMPRCRSAWLTALLNAHGVRTYHDVLLHQRPVFSRDYGVCDPTIAMLYPRQTLNMYAGLPVVCLQADDMEDRLDALDRWSGFPLTQELRRLYRINYAEFAENALLQVHVDELEDNEIVGDLIRYVSGVEPDDELIDIFQLLKIEEHWEKSLLVQTQQNEAT